MRAARDAGVLLRPKTGLRGINRLPEGKFELMLADGDRFSVERLCITAGSLKSSPLASAIAELGHRVEPPAPSLFAFNLDDPRTRDLAGVAVRNATVRSCPKGNPQSGPLLITHRGLSGPAILRLSAWEARSFQESCYNFEISVNWLGDVSENDLRQRFSELRSISGKSLVKNRYPEEIPRRLWERFLDTAGIDNSTQWSQLPKEKENFLIREITGGHFNVSGKTTNKDEFVTCGGVRLKEVDFRTMESKLVPGLFFAGECLDIDGITGGFNFQAAWTTARIAGLAMVDK